MSYTLDNEAREQLDPNTVTLNKLLAENCNLIQTISEFQNQGKLHEAAKYQALLHRNLMYLSREMDPSLIPELEEIGPPAQAQPISVGVAPSSVPPPSSSSAASPIRDMSRQPHSHSPYNGSHGPSSMNGHHTPQGYMQQQQPPPQPMMPQMPPHGHHYEMPNPYHNIPQGYMNGMPHQQPPLGQHMPPPQPPR